MPCNSDHMQANAHESYTGEVAKHIVYASKALGLPVFDWITAASANYYGAGDDSFKRRDEITAILCSICRSMTEEQKTAIIYDGRIPEARALAAWWDEHQAADAKREAEEAAAREAERGRALAVKILNGLPHETRAALVAAIKSGVS